MVAITGVALDGSMTTYPILHIASGETCAVNPNLVHSQVEFVLGDFPVYATQLLIDWDKDLNGEPENACIKLRMNNPGRSLIRQTWSLDVTSGDVRRSFGIRFEEINMPRAKYRILMSTNNSIMMNERVVIGELYDYLLKQAMYNA